MQAIKRSASNRPSAIAFASLIICICVFFLTGCMQSKTGALKEASPHLADASIEAGSDMTESGQYVEVRLEFDIPVEAASSENDISQDFDIRLNGATPDEETVRVSCSVENGRVVVRLMPTEAADGRSPSIYFALYDGQLSIAAASGNGTLPHVVASDGEDACAVLDDTVRFSVPSGVKLELIGETVGSAVDNVRAQALYRVDQAAQLRCISWLGLSLNGDVLLDEYGTPAYGDGDLSNGTLALKHNHLFYRDSPATCAADIASVISAAWPGEVIAEASGDTVALTSCRAVDGQSVRLVLFEGRRADG